MGSEIQPLGTVFVFASAHFLADCPPLALSAGGGSHLHVASPFPRLALCRQLKEAMRIGHA